MQGVYTKNEEYILFPQEGKNGIWYKNKMDFLNAKKTKQYPVDESPVNFFDRDKELINDFNFNFFINKLIEAKIVPKKDVYTYDDFTEISKNLNKLKKDGMLNEEIFYQLGYFMSECFRQKINGFWRNKVRFTFNLYWIPTISDDDKNTYCIQFWKNIESQRIIDLNEVFMFELARYYGIPALSREHANFIKEQKW